MLQLPDAPARSLPEMLVVGGRLRGHDEKTCESAQLPCFHHLSPGFSPPPTRQGEGDSATSLNLNRKYSICRATAGRDFTQGLRWIARPCTPPGDNIGR